MSDRRSLPVLSMAREIVFEKRCEYRGILYRGGRELDCCIHRHRSPAAARKCARRMLRQFEAALRAASIKETES